VLDNDEAAKVAERFGVAFEQVRRDHLISHLLAALGATLSDRVVLIGGTALARTHLPDGRLSEDIDLLSVGSRGEVVAAAERVLAGAVARQYGRLRWEPPLTGRRRAEPGVLRGAHLIDAALTHIAEQLRRRPLGPCREQGLSRAAAEENDPVGANGGGRGQHGCERVGDGAGERPVLREGLGGDQDQPGVLPAGRLVLGVEGDEILDVGGDQGTAGRGSFGQDPVVGERDQSRIGDDREDVVVALAQLPGDVVGEHLVQQQWVGHG
jgi:hypothetical protein